MDVLVVLFDLGLSGTASLPNVVVITFAGHAVHTWSLKSQVIIHMPKEIGYLPGREANRLDVVPGQHSVDAIESHVDKGKKGD
jgi:hypothetical protein